MKFIVEYGEFGFCPGVDGQGDKMANDGNRKDMEKTELYEGKSLDKWVENGEIGNFCDRNLTVSRIYRLLSHLLDTNLSTNLSTMTRIFHVSTTRYP